MQTRQVKNLIRASAIAAGVLATTLLGLACLRYSFAEPLVRLSYDLPFLWRTTLDTHEITLVYLDEASAKQLNQVHRSLRTSLSTVAEAASAIIAKTRRKTRISLPRRKFFHNKHG